jgi:hypothetical protein
MPESDRPDCDRPPDGAVVTMRLEGAAGILSCSVESCSGDALRLAVERFTASPPWSGPASLRWARPRGAPAEARGVVEQVAGMPGFQVIVRIAEPTDSLERRDYVRWPVKTPMELHVDGYPQEMDLVDLSEGGLSCRGRLHRQIAPGETVGVSFTSPELAFDAEADVVRVRNTRSLQQEVAVTFNALPVPTADAIRRFIFAEQTAMRAAQNPGAGSRPS